jgi:hypothetical protein
MHGEDLNNWGLGHADERHERNYQQLSLIIKFNLTGEITKWITESV